MISNNKVKIIVLTGTPGTGKSIISNLIEKKFKDCKVIRLNELINNEKIWTRKEKGCKVADLDLLRNSVMNKIKSLKKSNPSFVIIEGHLACELKLPVDAAIVLRTNPKVLLKRLEQRRYSKEKISENLQSEMLDYCTQRSELNFGNKVYEIDSSSNLSSTFSRVVRFVSALLSRQSGSKKEHEKSASSSSILHSYRPKINWSKYFSDKSLSPYLFD
jgi:adenylate kinase